jgi:hypothetical protein
MVVFVIVGIFFSCRNNEEELAFSFLKNEETEIKNKTTSILDELGFKNYKIFTFYHKDLGSKYLSRTVLNIESIGDGSLEAYTNDEKYPIWFSNNLKDFNGYFQSRASSNNYDANDKVRINLDYVSILVIFDRIEVSEKEYLLKILNSYIINAQRGDNIFVISREEKDNTNIKE